MIASLTSLMKNKDKKILNNVRITEREDKYGRYYELLYWLYNTEWKTRLLFLFHFVFPYFYIILKYINIAYKINLFRFCYIYYILRIHFCYFYIFMCI